MASGRGKKTPARQTAAMVIIALEDMSFTIPSKTDSRQPHSMAKDYLSPRAQIRPARQSNRCDGAVNSVDRRCRSYFGRFATTLRLGLFQQNRPEADRAKYAPPPASGHWV